MLQRVPNVVSLPAVLSTPLACTVPVRRLFDERFREYVHMSENEDAGALSLAFESVLSPDCLEDTAMGSEDSMHFQHDKLLHNVVKVLKAHLPQPFMGDTRNRQDGVSQMSPTKEDSRPDYLLWVGNELMFIGEEKAEDTKWKAALKDIASKTAEWRSSPLCRLPYILAYAATPSCLQFFAVVHGGDVVPISALFSLRDTMSRLLVVQCMVNVVRVLRTVESSMPAPLNQEEILPLFRVMDRPTSRVQRFNGHILKVL